MKRFLMYAIVMGLATSCFPEENLTQEEAAIEVTPNIVVPGCDAPETDPNRICDSNPGSGGGWGGTPGGGTPVGGGGGHFPGNGDPPASPCPPGQTNRGYGCESICSWGEEWHNGTCRPRRPSWQDANFCTQYPCECWGTTCFCRRYPHHEYCPHPHD